jgi:hypothetical protein
VNEPRTWRRLKRWGSWAVPFIAPWIDGKPQFGKKDHAKLRRCAYQRVCNVCGQKLDDVMVFAGGILATRALIFHEPPLHEACARAAMRICPYLAKLSDGRIPEGGMYFTFARSMRLHERAGSIAFIAGSVMRIETIVADPDAASVRALA